MKLTDFEVLTFDCYGTLIDWERGILETLKPWLDREGLKRGEDAVLAAFARFESQQQKETPDMLYPAVLGEVLRAMGREWSATVTDDDAAGFGASVGDWPPFPDTVDALRYLERHYKLVVLSNVDRASFARSNAKLGVAFEAVCTAEDIDSYKPDPTNFEYMIARLAERGIAKSGILHTAQSLFHDHAPAKHLGLATNWIDRRHDKPGSGAGMPPDAEVKPDFRATSMADFVRQHRTCLAEAAGGTR